MKTSSWWVTVLIGMCSPSDNAFEGLAKNQADKARYEKNKPGIFPKQRSDNASNPSPK